MRRSIGLAIITPASMATGYARGATGWERLGSREVDFKPDHDPIEVGRSEGRFKQLQMNVKSAPSEMSDMSLPSATMKNSAQTCAIASLKDRALAPSTFPALGERSSGSISNTAASTVAKAREEWKVTRDKGSQRSTICVVWGGPAQWLSPRATIANRPCLKTTGDQPIEFSRAIIVAGARQIDITYATVMNHPREGRTKPSRTYFLLRRRCAITATPAPGSSS